MAWKTNKRRRLWRLRRRRGLRRRAGFGRFRFRRGYGRSSLSRRVSRISAKLRTKGVYATEINYVRFPLATNAPAFNLDQEPTLDLTNIGTGDGTTTRDGGQIFIRHIKLYFAITAMAPTSAQLTAGPWISGGYQPWHKVTLLIVRDKAPPNAATSGTTAPKLADVFDTTLTTRPTSELTAMASDWVWNKVFAYNQDRFQVLCMKTLTVYANYESGKNLAWFKRRIRVMKNTYYTSTGSVDNAGPGQIWGFIWSNHVLYTPTGTPSPRFYFDARVSFTDA